MSVLSMELIIYRNAVYIVLYIFHTIDAHQIISNSSHVVIIIVEDNVTIGLIVKAIKRGMNIIVRIISSRVKISLKQKHALNYCMKVLCIIPINSFAFRNLIAKITAYLTCHECLLI